MIMFQMILGEWHNKNGKSKILLSYPYYHDCFWAIHIIVTFLSFRSFLCIRQCVESYLFKTEWSAMTNILLILHKTLRLPFWPDLTLPLLL